MNTQPLHVCAFESRRHEEMSRLIERSQGIPFVASSMREIPLSDNEAVFQFADQLLDQKIDIVIFMTGVGTEALFATLATRELDLRVQSAMESILLIARSSKPAAVLSKFKLKVNLRAPEPNTWKEIAGEFERHRVPLEGKSVAVQEYGEPSRDLYRWLEQRGARVFPVPVYKWALPDDLNPLQHAIQETINGQYEVLLWTSAQQAQHVLMVAETMGLQDDWKVAANRCVIGSIGPTASERLKRLGLPPDMEPSHPKMAHLVRETLAAAPNILAAKQTKASTNPN